MISKDRSGPRSVVIGAEPVDSVLGRSSHLVSISDSLAVLVIDRAFNYLYTSEKLPNWSQCSYIL